MRRIIRLEKKPYFLSYASAGGYEEKCGPLGDFFDISSEDDLFGQKTAEEAESEMARRCLNTALKKCALSHSALDVLLAGDLENQCNASSAGLFSFGIPYVSLLRLLDLHRGYNASITLSLNHRYDTRRGSYVLTQQCRGKAIQNTPRIRRAKTALGTVDGDRRRCIYNE